MNAITYERMGASTDVLVYGSQKKPEPFDGEVLVRLYASGVNPTDVKARAGKRAVGSEMPYPIIIPHSDGAGIIEAVGTGVSAEHVGKYQTSLLL